MFEKVNRHHPDKIADRIAGAIVDRAYYKSENPRVACEVLIGHNECKIINETSQHISTEIVRMIVDRIAGEDVALCYVEVPQNSHLARNQNGKIRCGDNGIFKGSVPTEEELFLSVFASMMDYYFDSDGKYIIARDKDQTVITVCQSLPSLLGWGRLTSLGILKGDKNAPNLVAKSICDFNSKRFDFLDNVRFIVNPLGPWTGGINVDTGATNRKLGSDMGMAVTGGGLHGKDLSKADVSVNIFAHLCAMEYGCDIDMWCSIGDEIVNGIPYSEIVEKAREYVEDIGGFERLAEYGLI